MSFRFVFLEESPYLPPHTSIFRLLFFITSSTSKHKGSFNEPGSFALSSENK